MTVSTYHIVLKSKMFLIFFFRLIYFSLLQWNWLKAIFCIIVWILITNSSFFFYKKAYSSYYTADKRLAIYWNVSGSISYYKLPYQKWKEINVLDSQTKRITCWMSLIFFLNNFNQGKELLSGIMRKRKH